MVRNGNEHENIWFKECDMSRVRFVSMILLLLCLASYLLFIV